MRLFEVLQPLLEGFKTAKEHFMKTSDVGRHIIESTLNDFKELRKRFKAPENDISHWIKEGWHEFYLFIEQKKREKTKGQIRKEIKEDDNIYTVVDNDHVGIVVPMTTKAACKYGQHGEWCISTRNMQRNLFNQYTREGKVFFIIELRDLILDEFSSDFNLVTLEYRPNTRPVLWTTSNSQITDGGVIEDFIEAIEESPNVPSVDYANIADTLRPEIQENVDGEPLDRESQYIEELIDNPNIATLDSHLDNIHLDDIHGTDTFEDGVSLYYGALAEAAIMKELNNATISSTDMKTIATYMYVVGGTADHIIGKLEELAEEGAIDSYDVIAFVDRLAHYNMDEDNEIVYLFIDRFINGYIKGAVSIGDITHVVQNETYAGDHLLDEIEDAILKKMYNNPDDEQILDDVDEYEMSSIGRPFKQKFLAARNRRKQYGAPNQRQQEIKHLDHALIYSGNNEKAVKPAVSMFEGHSHLSQVPKNIQEHKDTYLITDGAFNPRLILNFTEAYYVSLFNGRLDYHTLKEYKDSPAFQAIVNELKGDIMPIDAAEQLFSVGELSQKEFEERLDQIIDFMGFVVFYEQIMGFRASLWLRLNMISSRWLNDTIKHVSLNQWKQIGFPLKRLAATLDKHNPNDISDHDRAELESIINDIEKQLEV